MHLPLRGALAPLTLPGKVPSTLPNGLLNYWKLEEASGTRADSVGGKTLADNNTVTQAVGKIDNAGQFTAASLEWLSASDSGLVFAGVDFTVSAWVWSDALAGGNAEGRGIASVHNSDAIGDWHISVPTNGRVFFSHWTSAGSDLTGKHQTATGVITDGSWFHVVCRRTSGVYTIQVNDVDRSITNLSTSNGWTTTDFNMGRIFPGAGFSWNGRIDEVGIWNRSLSSAEVTELYAGGSGVTYPFS